MVNVQLQVLDNLLLKMSLLLKMRIVLILRIVSKQIVLR